MPTLCCTTCTIGGIDAVCAAERVVTQYITMQHGTTRCSAQRTTMLQRSTTRSTVQEVATYYTSMPARLAGSTRTGACRVVCCNVLRCVAACCTQAVAVRPEIATAPPSPDRREGPSASSCRKLGLTCGRHRSMSSMPIVRHRPLAAFTINDQRDGYLRGRTNWDRSWPSDPTTRHNLEMICIRNRPTRTRSPPAQGSALAAPRHVVHRK